MENRILWFYNAVMQQIDAVGMVNSADLRKESDLGLHYSQIYPF